MTVQYYYAGIGYATEAEAQSQVTAMKLRLENNPTDWCVVKELQANEDGSYLVLPTELTDTQIKNPDLSKKYLCYSIPSGGNYTSLSSTELPEKVAEFRAVYFEYERLDQISRVEKDSEGTVISVEPVTLNEDMSGYV